MCLSLPEQRRKRASSRQLRERTETCKKSDERSVQCACHSMCLSLPEQRRKRVSSRQLRERTETCGTSDERSVQCVCHFLSNIESVCRHDSCKNKQNHVG